MNPQILSNEPFIVHCNKVGQCKQWSSYGRAILESLAVLTLQQLQFDTEKNQKQLLLLETFP